MISFGIELEFILVSLFGDKWELEPKLEALLTQPINAGRCGLQGCNQQHDHQLKVTRLSLADGTLEKDRTWNVGEDVSVMLGETEKAQMDGFDMRWYAHRVEVRSPAFLMDAKPPTKSVDPRSHRPWFSPMWEIQQVLRLINDVNRPQKVNDNWRVFTNSTCALHVHVGSGVPSDGFDVEVVKKVMGLATVFERQFDSVTDVTRIEGSVMATQTGTSDKPARTVLGGTDGWSQPLSVAHAMHAYNMIVPEKREYYASRGRYPYRNHDSDLAQVAKDQILIAWNEVIQKAKTHRDLCDLYVNCALKTMVVNIMWLGGPERQTIEFRQHGGTLDFGEVMAWVNSVTAIVQWCQKVSANDFNRLVKRTWPDFSFKFTDLLHEVGAPNATIMHYKNVLAKAKPGEREYAEARYDDAMRVESANSDNNDNRDLRKIVRFVERERMQNRTRRAIDTRIHTKLCAGGYGKFPADLVMAAETPQEIWLQMSIMGGEPYKGIRGS